MNEREIFLRACKNKLTKQDLQYINSCFISEIIPDDINKALKQEISEFIKDRQATTLEEIDENFSVFDLNDIIQTVKQLDSEERIIYRDDWNIRWNKTFIEQKHEVVAKINGMNEEEFGKFLLSEKWRTFNE